MAFDAQSLLKSMTQRPGIYQMMDAEGTVLYVGKAKNLKNRVGSYFRKSGLSTKTIALVKRIAQIDVTVTETETEALILEHNLIKQYRPPFNILMRDDKSYPYIFLSDEKWPRLAFHRGPKKQKVVILDRFPVFMRSVRVWVSYRKHLRLGSARTFFLKIAPDRACSIKLSVARRPVLTLSASRIMAPMLS